MAKKVNKELRKFLGLWWIEPIEATIREMGRVPYRHVPRQPCKKFRPGDYRPIVEPTGN
jgi:hypothetical protein